MAQKWGRSSATTPTDDDSTLTAAAVGDYLLRNPQFFHEHSQLLLELSIPHESGRAISLLERQVTLFRERQEHLQDQFHEFLTNAHDNDNLFEKTRHMILALMKCQSLAAVRELVEANFNSEFNASASAPPYSLLYIRPKKPAWPILRSTSRGTLPAFSHSRP